MYQNGRNESNECQDSERILNTSFTWKWLEENLSASLHTNAKFGSERWAEQIGLGQGFLSTMARVHLNWIGDDSAWLPKTIIIKYPSIDSSRKVMADPQLRNSVNNAEIDSKSVIEKLDSILRHAHNTEVSFYEAVRKSEMKLKTPQTYIMKRFTKQCSQGVIVMEDAGEESFVLSPYETFSVDELKQVFSSLAAIHGFSLKNPECLGISERTLASLLISREQSKVYMGMLKMLRNDSDESLAVLIDEVEQNWNDICDAKLFSDLHKKMGIPGVLVHGDLWMANVIWKRKGEKRELAAIVDWQIIHPGCAAEDLARLMSSALAPTDRRENEKELLKHYYDALATSLGEPPPFTFDELRESFKRIYPATMALILPTFGPVMRVQLGARDVLQTEKLQATLLSKVRALAEDITRLHWENHQN